MSLGDLCEVVTPHSKGSLMEQTMAPSDQQLEIEDMLEPLKEKLLFLIDGNHERRAMKDAAMLMSKNMAKHLDCMYYPDSEARFGILLNDSRLVRCLASHNYGGGCTPGAKLNRLHNLHFRGPTCDAIFGGHTHSLTDDQIEILSMDDAGNYTAKIQQLVCGGTALRSHKGYPAQMGLKPSPPGLKYIVIESMTNGGNKYFKFKVELFQMM
jgi:hypothetical protein